MSKHLYLLRHGQTEWSQSGRHTGRTDIPLTPEGEQQARRAGATLARLRGTDVPPTITLTSPRTRAVRTAELAGLEITEQTELLAEWDYGDYEGITTPQIRETVPGWTVWTHPVPRGETHEQIRERARQVLAKIKDYDDVVLVGHGHFSRVLTAAWLGLPPDHGVHFGLDPAGITVLGDERGDPQIRSSNIPAWEV